IRDGDGFPAVGARSAGTDAPAEQATVRAALLAPGARPTGRALVNRGRAGCPQRGREDRGTGLAAAPGGLATGGRAVAAAPSWHDRLPAAGAGYRHAIVTPRGAHAVPPDRWRCCRVRRKRKESEPVSMMWARSVRRSSSA